MNEYIIFTDSGCDLSPALLAQWNVDSCSLSFLFDGEESVYGNNDMSPAEFYAQMRSGKLAKTAAVNPEAFAKKFEAHLKQGRDILYLGFSGTLSTTYNSAVIAASELAEAYPDRKIITVDTLSASAGEALLIYLTLQEKEKGATIEEAAQFAEQTKPQICQWFTTDTLTYLKRGGRISAASAVFGNMLDIRPVLHVDAEGGLSNVKKVRGRKASIQELSSRVVRTAAENSPVFISHADCEADAEALAQMIFRQTGLETQIITHVGPVIGAHAGPGTLALFFVGSER
ncbi:MAG: DegV family protein [Oscillospiraceae bacterium]|nr:DegV family protein [Oscillospiraceae bacterium]